MIPDGSFAKSRQEAVLLIARRHDLNRLLGSPACPPGLVTRVDAHVPDRSRPDEPFVAMEFERFLESADASGGGELDRNLLRHSGRRIVTLHSVEDEAGVEDVFFEIESVRARLAKMVGFQAQHEARWYPVVIFRRSIRPEEIPRLRAYVRSTFDDGGENAPEGFRIGRIPTMYVMDRLLHMTSGRELLLSEFVWPAYVVPLLLRIQGIGSDASEERDRLEVCAWRLLEIGPSIPKKEFRSFFESLLGGWRDARRGKPFTPASAGGLAPPDASILSKELRVGEAFEIRFVDGSRIESTERIIRRALPSAAEQVDQRQRIGERWRLGVREYWRSRFGLRHGTVGEAAETWESGVWTRVRNDPAMLFHFARQSPDRGGLEEAISIQTKAWRDLCERATRWHRDRRRSLAKAQIQDQKERHFVSQGGRLMLASFAILLVYYLFMAVMEPIVPGVPWWLHGGVAGGVLGAISAAIWSHLVERRAGEQWAQDLEVMARALVREPLPVRTLEVMREGMAVGARQAETFSQEVVAKIAKRAATSIDRAERELVGGRVDADSGLGLDAFSVISHQQRQDAIVEEALVVRTHGTRDSADRERCLRDWEEYRDESGGQETAPDRHAREFLRDWQDGVGRIDPTRAGHLPHQALMEFWERIVADRQRAIYAEMMVWISNRPGPEAERSRLAQEIRDKFIRPGNRSGNPVGLSCGMRVPDGPRPSGAASPPVGRLVMARERDLEWLRSSLKGTAVEQDFKLQFPGASVPNPHWAMDGRVFLFQEVDVPDGYPRSGSVNPPEAPTDDA